VLFIFYVVACICNAVVMIVTFFLYIGTRLTSREPVPGFTAEQNAQRLKELDRREQRYQSIHFITLALFVLFGVLILVYLSGKLNQGTITGNSGRHSGNYFFIKGFIA
jgi:hypothetical protein